VVEVLVIPDGAAEPLGPGPTSLERARTPALDALCRAGAVRRVATTPPRLPAGSETGIPVLLGASLATPVSRGLVEAASAGIAIPPGARAWRCDLPGRAVPSDPDAVVAALAASVPGHAVHHLRGHRFLLVGPGRPAPRLHGVALGVWDDGAGLPRILDHSTVVVCGPGAAAGCGQLMGAQVLVPAGATGGGVTDLAAKAATAWAAIERGARRVVVHVAAPDEAAHERDPAAKVAALEAVDAQLIAPLGLVVQRAGGRIAVCPDHGADPRTGEHDEAPVPGVVYGDGVAAAGPGRLTERAVAGLAASLPETLRAAGLEAAA
jgi:2,3-bisphosphoglycerate-independent phosphoglycerate mutase